VTWVGRGSYEITLKPHLDLRNIVTDAATVRTGCIITKKNNNICIPLLHIDVLTILNNIICLMFNH